MYTNYEKMKLTSGTGIFKTLIPGGNKKATHT